ncbi:hypothetical protein C4D60_Mb02t07270 [Musa balbisiana]|uniref:Uncharacterized protein n=1 Tax=Musa balbisiana TaxID=52838 RepID=A0A4S8I8X6_MUSBA|nr:hypothetical protein C4D60_Mb02t07270 [Musa balbisiana]
MGEAFFSQADRAPSPHLAKEGETEMGGSQSSFKFASCLFVKPKCNDDDADWYVSRKVRPSDEDRGWWVGEPDVDRKASAFIAKFHASRIMDLESHETPALDAESRTVAA